MSLAWWWYDITWPRPTRNIWYYLVFSDWYIEGVWMKYLGKVLWYHSWAWCSVVVCNAPEVPKQRTAKIRWPLIKCVILELSLIEREIPNLVASLILESLCTILGFRNINMQLRLWCVQKQSTNAWSSIMRGLHASLLCLFQKKENIKKNNNSTPVHLNVDQHVNSNGIFKSKICPTAEDAKKHNRRYFTKKEYPRIYALRCCASALV